MKFLPVNEFAINDRNWFSSKKSELSGNDLKLSVEELALKNLMERVKYAEDLSTTVNKCISYKLINITGFYTYSAYLGTTVKGHGKNDFWLSEYSIYVEDKGFVWNPCVATSCVSNHEKVVRYKDLNEIENVELREFGKKIWIEFSKHVERIKAIKRSLGYTVA